MGGVSIQLPWVVKTAVNAEAKTHCHLTRPRGLKKCTKLKNGCSRCVSDGVGSQQGALAEEHTGRLLLEPGQRNPRLCRTVVQMQISPTTNHIHETYLPSKIHQEKNPIIFFLMAKEITFESQISATSQWNSEQYLSYGFVTVFLLRLFTLLQDT